MKSFDNNKKNASNQNDHILKQNFAFLCFVLLLIIIINKSYLSTSALSDW